MANVTLEKVGLEAMSPNAVTPSELTELLLAFYPNRSPKVHISGPPGCGKSSIVYQAFRDILKVPVYVYQAMLYDMTEVKGLPVYTPDGKAKFLPFEDMKSGEEGVLFIDDLPHAPSQTQNAFMRLVLEGVAGAWDLGNLYPVTAGNRSRDRAGAKDLQTAMATRFDQIELVTNYNDWRGWAVTRTHPAVIAFLGSPYGAGFLNRFDPSQQCNPTQRTWQFVSEAMYSLEGKKSLLNKAIAGCVGIEATTKFMGWMNVYQKLPDLNKIIAGEDIFDKELDVMYAVISGLVSIASQEKKDRKAVFQRLLDYATKMPQEFAELGAYLGKDLFRVDLKLFEKLDIDAYEETYEGLVV